MGQPGTGPSATGLAKDAAGLTEFSRVAGAVRESIGRIIVGKTDVVELVMVALLCDGHILLEDVPGVGKTMMARSVAASLGLRFARVQCTPDLLPADIVGTSVYNPSTREFEFRPGPVMNQIVLTDEINRATPRTQSALLEAMGERQVTVDGTTRGLTAPFLVIATQNPIEFEGTFPLPESQLDRFMMRIEVAYPAGEDERHVLEHYGTIASVEGPAAGAAIGTTLGPEAIAAARACADRVHVSNEILEYILALARASREQAQIALGLSTRGAIALLRAARVAAGLRGGEFVTPDDVKRVTPWVVPHRLALTPEALLEAVHGRDLAATLLERVVVPR